MGSWNGNKCCALVALGWRPALNPRAPLSSTRTVIMAACKRSLPPHACGHPQACQGDIQRLHRLKQGLVPFTDNLECIITCLASTPQCYAATYAACSPFPPSPRPHACPSSQMKLLCRWCLTAAPPPPLCQTWLPSSPHARTAFPAMPLLWHRPSRRSGRFRPRRRLLRLVPLKTPPSWGH